MNFGAVLNDQIIFVTKTRMTTSILIKRGIKKTMFAMKKIFYILNIDFNYIIFPNILNHILKFLKFLSLATTSLKRNTNILNANRLLNFNYKI